MKPLVRLLQLLNVRRTIALENSYLAVVQGAAKISQSAVEIGRAYVRSQTGNPIDVALGAAVRGSVLSNLETIQHLMATGQIKEAKLALDSLILVTRAERSNVQD